MWGTAPRRTPITGHATGNSSDPWERKSDDVGTVGRVDRVHDARTASRASTTERRPVYSRGHRPARQGGGSAALHNSNGHPLRTDRGRGSRRRTPNGLVLSATVRFLRSPVQTRKRYKV